ncbi:MAG: IclR family transcriptional regulator [Pseudolabrys sp.]|nr:IclR family transcriptional regulator [Pseudolabrys sp.]
MTTSRVTSKSAASGAPKRAGRAVALSAVAEPDDDSRNIVNSLAKGFRVLEAFTAERSELTLTEVGALANLDPGTAFRMLNTLVMLGYVSRVPDSRRFRLTLKVTDLGLHAIGRADLRETARPILRSMVGELNEAASLGVLDGSDVLYIDRVRAGLTRMGVDIRIGTTIPAYCSAIGQAILAYLPPAELARLLALPPRAGHLPTKPMSKEEIKRDLADVRAHGYALRDSYFGSGLRVLSAPVLDIDNYPVAAVSVAAPAVRMPAKEFKARALEPVLRAAKDIARAIQASGTVSATA